MGRINEARARRDRRAAKVATQPAIETSPKSCFVPSDDTEDGWRAAARVRLAFLSQSLPATPSTSSAAFAGLPRALWENDDARWLLNVHEATGEWYFNKELHERMLWWMQLPDLLQIATPDEKKAHASGSVKAIESAVETAIEEAEEAGFRLSKEKEVVAKPAEQEKGALTT